MRFWGYVPVVVAACSPASGGGAPPAAPPPPSSAPESPKPPVARKEPVETTLLGHKRVDDYKWLQRKKAPDVEAYLEAENAYTAKMTAGTEALQKTLYDELLGRVKEDDSTPPYTNGKYSYYRRFEKGKQYPLRCRKKLGDDKEVVYLDQNEIGKNEAFIDIAHAVVSDDGNVLAYLVDTAGFRQYTLKTKNLLTNETGSEAIPRADGVAFSKDGKTIWYVTEDATTKRRDKLFRHTIGTDSANDVLLYEEKDESFDLEVERTTSLAYAVVTSRSHTTSEVRVIDSGKPTAEPVLIAKREQDHEYYVDHRGDSFYIRTNSGGRNYRIVSASVTDPQRAKWKEIIPHRADVMLESLSVFKDFFVVEERQDALPQLAVFDFKTGKSTRIDQPEPVFDVSLAENAEFDTSQLRFRFQSPKTPVTYFDWDTKTKARVVLKRTEVPHYDSTAYDTKRVLVPARDGTQIPVSLVFKKGTQPDGTHPAYLYGYGAYGIPTPLSFSSDRISLLDRGFVFALAHIRGSGDLGKKWHDAGRMQQKMNTFTDFIDVADQLGKHGWVKKDNLVVAGGSAGGLLMGAVVNMRPDLFKVVMAYVPFVDVINTMLDESLPLTVNEFEEWGNPKKKPDYDAMIQYSPYDNVEKKAYPTMLVRTSYNDSQVMYWEPAKWVAKLRAMKTDTNPLLLKIAMKPAGHGGQSGRYDRLKDTAFDYAFIIEQLGLH